MRAFRFFVAVAAFVFVAGGAAAQGFAVSGVLDSSVTANAGAGDAPAFSYGIEEYANIRMQARIREDAVFYGAVNLVAAAGNAAKNAALLGAARNRPGIAPSAFASGENYIAALELERLYFRLNGDSVDFDGGLMRMPFGYGQIWGPSDFLNPKNPLFPDARPRGVLGGTLSWYPSEMLTILGFGAAGRDPFSETGAGGLAGVSMDKHWSRASVQLLYAFESPADGSDRGIHRVGMSVKADVEVGLTMDALYAYNAEAGTGIDGLSFSIGGDYSFFDGNLIVLAEYLYNGTSSSTSAAGGNLMGLSRRHYLAASFTWRFSDYTSLTAVLVSGIDDVSFTPLFTLSHDIFQGCVLVVSAQVPLDRALFSGGDPDLRGELGPIPPGSDAGGYFVGTAKIRLRF
jgi:hypothetical protein